MKPKQPTQPSPAHHHNERFAVSQPLLSDAELPLLLSPLPATFGVAQFELFWGKMHPPLTIYNHPMCADIIEMFLKCHSDHPVGKFFGECTDLKIKLDRCFRQEKVVKRRKNLEKSRKLRETLQSYRKETAQEGNE